MRRQRRRRLLEGAGGITTGGNGTITGCVWCGGLVADVAGYLRVLDHGGRVRHLRVRKLEQDRILIGGPYSLWNLAAACGPCNRGRVYTEVEVMDGCWWGPATRDAVTRLWGAGEATA